MAARKTAARNAARKARPSEPCFYLGCFFFDEPGPGDEDRDGSFQVVVEAASPDQALQRMRARIRKLRTTTSLFDSPISIYLEGIIELRGSFAEGVLVNWESGIARLPPDVRLTNLIPEQKDTDARDYGLAHDSKDGHVEPFLDFGGQALARALNAAKESPADHGRAQTPRGGPFGSAFSHRYPQGSPALGVGLPKPKPTPEEKAAAREAALAKKAQRLADRTARRDKRLAKAEAAKVRRETIAVTMAELRSGSRSRPDAPPPRRPG